jgi:hypothetical protein
MDFLIALAMTPSSLMAENMSGKIVMILNEIFTLVILKFAE